MSNMILKGQLKSKEEPVGNFQKVVFWDIDAKKELPGFVLVDQLFGSPELVDEFYSFVKVVFNPSVPCQNVYINAQGREDFINIPANSPITIFDDVKPIRGGQPVVVFINEVI